MQIYNVCLVESLAKQEFLLQICGGIRPGACMIPELQGQFDAIRLTLPQANQHRPQRLLVHAAGSFFKATVLLLCGT